MHWTRRRLLATAGASAATGLAGCGGSDDDPGTDTGDETTTATATTATGTTGTTTRTTTGDTTTTTAATESTDDTTPTRTTTTTTTTTAEAEPGIDHPAAAALASQPALGPADAPALIVAFEDPSCRTCRRFENQSFPTLKREYVDAGSLRFVYRVFPVVFRGASRRPGRSRRRTPAARPRSGR